MPYNTRRKSLSLPSLGIHIPTSHAGRSAAAASKGAGRPSSTSTYSMSSPPSRSESNTASHSSKRQKRSHNDSRRNEQTPPPSPSLDGSAMSDVDQPAAKVDFEGIKDDIVEAVIVQLQSTANRPHLVKELALVLAQRLAVVQHSANPCAIISSRLAAYLKRSCWTARSPCPLAKELESVHPRRTYFFLAICPRQPLPDASAPLLADHSLVTPSVSLTDDSGSDDVEARRRELSPSPEVDLSPHQFEDGDEDVAMPATPIGLFPNNRHYIRHPRDNRHGSPPLEKDEREFTQTADGLQKRKLNEITAPNSVERNAAIEYGSRDDGWFGDNGMLAPSFLMSPSMKPSTLSNTRKEDESDNWLKLGKLMEWDKGAESIEIDELDILFDSC